MRSHDSTAPSSSAIRGGVLVLSGYGLRVTVERGHLAVSDGYCDVRRRMRLHRATSGLRRLVLLGSSGFVTLEALRFLHDIGAAVVQIGQDGEILLASGPRGLDDARLRRSQALAPAREVGLRITRELLRAKLQGQAAVLDALGAPRVAISLQRAATALDHAGTLDRLRMIEADGAAMYGEVWKEVPFPFARRDERLVPGHWRLVGPRASALTGASRLATSPAQSLRNYLLAVAESEARVACEAVGLDAGLGIMHVDTPARASMALDILEVTRPRVDMFLLILLRERVFSRDDFEETRRGVCRVMPPLVRHLAETGPRWARDVAPWAERVASLLMTDASGRRAPTDHVPTPLTQANRSAGRDGVRRQPRKASRQPEPALPPACRECGAILPHSDRSYCDECLQDRYEEALPTFLASGPAALRRLMAEGRDPAHGGQAARKRGAIIARRNRERSDWDQARVKPPDPTEFTRTILPRLQSVPLRRIMEATGLSLRYCSIIRRGLYVPHPRHWGPLRQIERHSKSTGQGP